MADFSNCVLQLCANKSAGAVRENSACVTQHAVERLNMKLNESMLMC